MLRIVQHGFEDYEILLKKVRERLFTFMETMSKGYEETSKQVFGEVLSPDLAVRRILQQVKQEGDNALIRFTKQFDSVNLGKDGIAVSGNELTQACEQVPDSFLTTLKTAIDNVRSFQKMVRHNTGCVKTGTFQRKALPVDRAGIYIPGGSGGTTPLISSVYMNVIPAVEAGVNTISVCTPPSSDGSVSPYILAALQECGVTNIYKIGGAQAVGALAFGTETVDQVDIVAGPGNLFVMLAKKEVFGTVGIDMLAGPSEILIIADSTADPDAAAVDLIAQAEHDPLSSSILVTTDDSFAENVNKALATMVPDFERKEIIERSLQKYGGIVLCENIEHCVETANRIAPEHLEIITQDPEQIAQGIRNAGAVFLGPYTPEVLGDYVLGPSHTLPTGGTARFFSGLSAETFMKKTTFTQLTKQQFDMHADNAGVIAEKEGLCGHMNSITIRKK